MSAEHDYDVFGARERPERRREAVYAAGVAPPVRIHRWRGAAAVTLAADDVEATFLPELGMVGSSLVWRGHDVVAFPGGTRATIAGHTNGLPLLHPWANRLAGRRYVAGGKAVDLRGVALHTDRNGLPMHGLLLGDAGWDIVSVEARHGAPRMAARFDFGGRPDLLEAFPFPHVIELDITLDGRQLSVTTTVRATSGPVPISFGWHLYLQVPGPRRAWRLRMPALEHLHLDRKMIPNGRRSPQGAEDAAIDDRTLDDGYALGDDRCFSLTGDGLRLDVDFDGGYPYAQVWVPPERTFACIEPMTAPTNALRSDAYALATPDAPYTATYALRVS